MAEPGYPLALITEARRKLHIRCAKRKAALDLLIEDLDPHGNFETYKTDLWRVSNLAFVLHCDLGEFHYWNEVEAGRKHWTPKDFLPKPTSSISLDDLDL